MSRFAKHSTQRVDPRHLQDFLAVVEHGSITAAAAHRFVGTSSVSQSIARLERRLGVTLFERGPSGSKLTLRGRGLVEPVRDALAALDRLELDSDLALAASPHLSVLTTPSLADDPTALLLGCLHAELPNLRVTIADPPGSSIADALYPVMSDTVDVAVIETPPAAVPGARLVRLPEHHLRLVSPPGTPAPNSGVFDGGDLLDIGMIVAPRFETSDVYRHLRSIEPRIDQAFVMRSQHRDAFADFAREGVGAVILERSSAERAAQRGCVVGEIAGLPPRRITAVAKEDRSTPALERFLQLCAVQNSNNP